MSSAEDWYVTTPLKRRGNLALKWSFRIMETPADIDTLLHSILEQSRTKSPNDRLSVDDRSFVSRMVEAVNTGSKGVFIVVNADNSLDYLIANDSRIGAIAILARMIQRTARHVEEEGAEN